MPSSDDTGSQADAAPKPAQLDDLAFDALFRESAADVHGYAISLLGSRAAAEDVTALAFERLYRARRVWTTVAERPGRGCSRLRVTRRSMSCAAGNASLRASCRESFSDERETEGPFEQIARRAAVRDALAALPLREREVVLLKFHGQLSNSEAREGTRRERVKRRHPPAPRAHAPARGVRCAEPRGGRMRVIPFPGASGRGPEESWLAAGARGGSEWSRRGSARGLLATSCAVR